MFYLKKNATLGASLGLIKKSAFVILFFIPITVNGANQPDECQVSTVWSGNGVRSGYIVLGKFRPEVGKKLTIKTFTLENQKIVTVGVKYVYKNESSKGLPVSINIAISISDKISEDLFDEANVSIGSTRYSKNLDLMISRNVKIGDKIYAANIVCWNGNKWKK